MRGRCIFPDCLPLGPALPAGLFVVCACMPCAPGTFTQAHIDGRSQLGIQRPATALRLKEWESTNECDLALLCGSARLVAMAADRSSWCGHGRIFIGPPHVRRLFSRRARLRLQVRSITDCFPARTALGTTTLIRIISPDGVRSSVRGVMQRR